MAYLGNAPAKNFISFERQVFTIVNSQTAYTLDHSVTNENDIRLVVNNVVQEPGSGKAYTASGTTLTLSAALTNGTDEMYCVFLGRAVGTVNAPAGSVSTSQLAGDAVTEAKIADGAVESEHLNNNVISGQTELAAEPADTDEFLVSDAGTLKRIDYSHIKGTSGLSFISNNTIPGGGGEIDITNQFSSSFVNYKVIGSGINMATDNVQLRMRMLKESDDSQENASQYNYSIVGQRGAGNAVDDGAVNAAEYVIISNSANTGQSINFEINIYKPFVSGHYTSFTHICGGRRSGGDGHMTSGGGYLNLTTQYSGIKFYFSSGTISAGNIIVFGISDS